MSGFSYREGQWRSPASGYVLAYRLWQPDTAQATLVLVHGFGEHAGRHVETAEAMARAGIAVAAPDLWGHGRSSGPRGKVDLRRCVGDLQQLTTQVCLPALGASRYALLGHSFGGLLAIIWALRRPPELQRLVVESPLLEVGFPIPWWKATAAAALSVLWPSCPFSADLDLSALSHDPAVVKAYREDPLVHGTITAGTYRETIQLRDQVMREAKHLRVPTLLLTAGFDHIVSVEAERRWYAQLQCQKQQREFPESFHELHHETVREEVFQLIQQWVLSVSS